MGYGEAKLAEEMAALGVCRGDILFVHSSFKSLGPVEGGAATVIAAFERALGTEGLLLMPSFNLVKRPLRASTWDLAATPSTVGWLTEFFRTLPGVVRSDHYSHSVAARGKGAAEFVSGHRSQEGMDSPWDLPPWGKTYGDHSPMMRAYAGGGKILMLGVDYLSSTYGHVVEVMVWTRLRRMDPALPFTPYDRLRMGAEWDALGRLRRGRIGDAECRLFPIRDFVDTLTERVARDPSKWRCPSA